MTGSEWGEWPNGPLMPAAERDRFDRMRRTLDALRRLDDSAGTAERMRAEADFWEAYGAADTASVMRQLAEVARD